MSTLSIRLYSKRIKRELAALDKCRQHLDVVEADPQYKDVNNPTRGKCYFAAVALFKFLGGSRSGYAFMKAEDDLGTHYWVQNQTGGILDPTIDQFVLMNREPPYHLGKAVSIRPNVQSHKPLLEAMLKH